MALTLNNIIPAVGLVKNPIVAELETDNYEISAGSKATGELDFSGGGAAANDSFILSWPKEGISITFLFVAGAPDDTGTQIPAYPGGVISDWIDNDVIPNMELNYLLVRDFVFSRSGDKVVFSSIETGAEFSLSITDSVPNMSTSTTAGTDRSVRDNFKVKLDIYVELNYNDGAFTLAAELDLVPDDDNLTFFHFQNVLWSVLNKVAISNNRNLPSHNQSTVTIAEGSFIRYFLRYSEFFGDPPEYQKLNQEDPDWAYLGGLDFMDFPGTDYFATWLPANKRFLSWRDTTRIVTLVQQEFLNYLIYKSGTTTLKLKVKMFYSDDTDSTETAKTKTPVIWKEAYLFPAGYAQLDLDSLKTAGKTILKYQLWLLDQADAIISEVITYKIDRENRENERFFIYQNSLSGNDTLRCTGILEQSINVKRQISERIQDTYWTDNPVNDGQFINELNKYQDNYTISTGYKDNVQAIIRMKELLISPAIREIRDGKLVPVMIIKNSFVLAEDDNHEFALAFEYVDAFDNLAYSEI